MSAMRGIIVLLSFLVFHENFFTVVAAPSAPVDGGWATWHKWGACLVTCSRERIRKCTNPNPKHGGADCPGNDTETESCTGNKCAIADGNWTPWSYWTACSTSCGLGIQDRERNCTNPTPSGGGMYCLGNSTEYQDCNVSPCPIDGGWSSWSNWDSCDATCGGGIQSRLRNCSNPEPLHGGQNCPGGSSESQSCSTSPCPVDGGWNSWSNWETCDVTCGTGTQSRSRICSSPEPQAGGQNCSGMSDESQSCNINSCPIDGGWSSWSNWETCDLTCGSRTQSRLRNCSNPEPQYGGQNCSGVSSESQPCNTNFCPINGGWRSWSNWESCDVTCGTGTQSRLRNCSNPEPQYGGQNCSGDSSESQSCNANICPIDGGWSFWNNWESCDVTCGTGTQSRLRNCSNPKPQYSGQNCSGVPAESRSCNTNLCPTDGGWSGWYNWESCDNTCGTGTQSRLRNCSNPEPQYGGQNCSGVSAESQSCNTNPCPVDGGWRSWYNWESCDVTCGTGTQSRLRNCSNPEPQYGGQNCSGTSSESQSCNTNLCPIDGGWRSWSNWESCDVTCGTGIQSRLRHCSNPEPQYGGQNCSGDLSEIQSCNTNLCPIDGEWSSWYNWEICDVTCGTGTQSRLRNCSNPEPQYGGQNCSGASSQSQPCNTNLCPIDGGWSSWYNWESCEVTCGTGTQLRLRNCSNPEPQYGGQNCSGVLVEIRSCNTNPCPIDGGWGSWLNWESCDVTCGTGTQSRLRNCSNPEPQYGGQNCSGLSAESQHCNSNHCPVDGGWSSWCNWESCDVTCGTGTQSRLRNCSYPEPQHGGQNCSGVSIESQSCNINPCPIDGGWSAWLNWENCAVTCGSATQSRLRNCSSPEPQYGGQNCSGATAESQTCNANVCPIDGEWSAWFNWANCDVTCDTGTQSRLRNCSNPDPQHGGQNCSGASSESQLCNTNTCLIDGSWSPWSVWEACDGICGIGTQQRLRNCSNPEPQYGGQNCSGVLVESQSCNTNPCPIDGGWSSWLNWESCDVTCGSGTQSRLRNCSNPEPQYGGQNCSELSAESQPCNSNHCPVDGGWSSWYNWESCDITCGTGTQSRLRNCSYPEPQHGGQNCSGVSIQSQSCNTNPCPIDGGWSAWLNWENCAVTCGSATQSRLRSCSSPEPQYGGQNCSGATSESQTCNANACPIDGEWSAWFNWANCEVTCGTGTQSRLRNCSNPDPQHGGQNCSGASSESQLCNTNTCPIDGSWSPWSVWEACDVTCGTGTQQRLRNCSNPEPRYGGQNCSGALYESHICNTNFCSVDGDWSSWSNWGICDVTCGAGTQSRFRNCSSPEPQYGGQDCSGVSSEIQACNTISCPIDGGFTHWSSWTSCSVSCGFGIQTRNRSCSNPILQHGGSNCSGTTDETSQCYVTECPSFGNWTDWGEWSFCTLSCGGGSQIRSRNCTSLLNDAVNCTGDANQTKVCSTNNCPVVGQWNSWTSWNSCSLSCGGGLQLRVRNCNHPLPLYGGLNCTGVNTESQECNVYSCAIDGSWSFWSSWEGCTTTCGFGVNSRLRNCSNPSPLYGGQDCLGISHENQTCNNIECPVDGLWSDWMEWSACTTSCNNGTQQRTRGCSNPVPQNGGDNCTGLADETQICNSLNCPVDGSWSEWSEWSVCATSCNNGTRRKSRTCSNPEPQHGGASCAGSAEETEACGVFPCPINGQWSSWSVWSSCSSTCGNGTYYRTRNCSNPYTQHGGQNCTGINTEMEECNTILDCPIDSLQFSSNFYSTSIYENSATDTFVCNITTSTEASVLYSIVPNNQHVETFFKIDPNNGWLFVNQSCDRETVTVFDFVVKALENGNSANTAETNIRVTILDRNDNTPIFSQSYYDCEVSDYNFDIGSFTLTTISATDADTGQNSELVYGISGSNIFYVDPDTGNVLVSDTSQIQRGAKFVLTTSVRDNGSPQNFASPPATIRVDSFDPRATLILVDIPMSEQEFLKHKDGFITIVENKIKFQHPYAVAKIYGINENSGSDRRKRNSDVVTTVYVYAVTNPQATSSLSSLEENKVFVQDLLSVVQESATDPTLTTLNISDVRPLSGYDTTTPVDTDITSNSRNLGGVEAQSEIFASSSGGIALFAVLGIFILCGVLIAIIIIKKKTKDKNKQSFSPRRLLKHIDEDCYSDRSDKEKRLDRRVTNQRKRNQRMSAWSLSSEVNKTEATMVDTEFTDDDMPPMISRYIRSLSPKVNRTQVRRVRITQENGLDLGNPGEYQNSRKNRSCSIATLSNVELSDGIQGLPFKPIGAISEECDGSETAENRNGTEESLPPWSPFAKTVNKRKNLEIPNNSQIAKVAPVITTKLSPKKLFHPPPKLQGNEVIVHKNNICDYELKPRIKVQKELQNEKAIVENPIPSQIRVPRQQGFSKKILENKMWPKPHHPTSVVASNHSIPEQSQTTKTIEW